MNLLTDTGATTTPQRLTKDVPLKKSMILIIMKNIIACEIHGKMEYKHDSNTLI